MPSPFFVDAQNDYGQPLAGLGNMIGEAAKQKKALALQQQQKDNLMKAMQSGNRDMIMQASMDAPELAEAIRKGYDFADDKAKDEMAVLHRKVALASDEEIPQLIMDTYRDKTSRGISTPITGAALEILRDESILMEERIKKIKKQNLDLFAASQPEAWDDFASQTGIGGSDWSAQESMQMRDGNDNVWDITTMTNKNGQSKANYTPLDTDGIGENAFNPVGAEIIQSSTGMTGTEETTEAARLNSIRIAQGIGEGYYKQVEGIDSTLRNLEEARDEIDAGANTGWADKWLPTFRASTLALESAANRLGLDVIGSVTFGALSEGELRLAMDTALPLAMEEKELREWINKRMVAKQKLRNYLESAAMRLTGYNTTLPDFIAEERMLREEKLKKPVEEGGMTANSYAEMVTNDETSAPRSASVNSLGSRPRTNPQTNPTVR